MLKKNLMIIYSKYSKLKTRELFKFRMIQNYLFPKVVQDSVQELLLLVPQIKSNISDAIAMVPEVGFHHFEIILRSKQTNTGEKSTEGEVE